MQEHYKQLARIFVRVIDTLGDVLLYRGVIYTVLVVAVFGALFSFLTLSAPRAFPQNVEVYIAEGSSLRQVAEILEEESIIRSPVLFQVAVQLKNHEGAIRAGTYMFPERLNLWEVADALVTGEYEVPPRRVTIFEGMDNREIAELIAYELDLNEERFIELAEIWEGYLFPETYFVPAEYDEEDVITLMRTTFEEKVAPLQEEIDASGFSLHEVIVLASIIEGEARSEESMRMVSGILQNRLAIDMPLQVDAVFVYLLGRGSAELTRADLATDSPYNTYTNVGLPPTPISNPGLASIEAVLNPTPSEYFFYLTASNGVFHYSRTFQEHQRNIELHL